MFFQSTPFEIDKQILPSISHLYDPYNAVYVFDRREIDQWVKYKAQKLRANYHFSDLEEKSKDVKEFTMFTNGFIMDETIRYSSSITEWEFPIKKNISPH